MTALSGGGRPTVRAPDSTSTVADRPESNAAAARPRPLDQIFPLRGDANRGRGDARRPGGRSAAIALRRSKPRYAAGRSRPEIAYQLGELLHNHFRTRGVTLTTYELRRLIAELLALHGPPPQQMDKPAGNVEAPPIARADTTVPFDAASRGEGAGPGYTAPAPSAPGKTLRPPPPTVAFREPAPFAQLLSRALDLVKGRLVSRDRGAVRAVVDGGGEFSCWGAGLAGSNPRTAGDLRAQRGRRSWTDRPVVVGPHGARNPGQWSFVGVRRSRRRSAGRSRELPRRSAPRRIGQPAGWPASERNGRCSAPRRLEWRRRLPAGGADRPGPDPSPRSAWRGDIGANGRPRCCSISR